MSRDGRLLDSLAQAVCAYALAGLKEQRQQNKSESSILPDLLQYMRKPQKTWSSDKSISISPLSEEEVLDYARIHKDDSATGNTVIARTHRSWWPISDSSLRGAIFPKQGFNTWSCEHMPLHKLQIDASKFKVNVHGNLKTPTGEAFQFDLTHSQLVDLADALDLYYIDSYTAPGKKLVSGMELEIPPYSRSKIGAAFWAAIQASIVGGVLLVGLLVASKLQKFPSGSAMALNVESSFVKKWCQIKEDHQPVLPVNEQVSASEMEKLCILVVGMVQDLLCLPQEIKSSSERGAWLGTDLTQWGRIEPDAQVELSENGAELDRLNSSTSENETEATAPKALQKTQKREDVLLYQVILSRDGKLKGFQPGNKAAIQQWAYYPFAQILHKRHKLGAGLYEAGLKFTTLQEEVVVIELVVSNDASGSVSARPFQLTNL